MKPIQATATIKMENTLAGRYHIQICEAKRINRTALGWQCFVNRICTAVIDCSRWQHIQRNAYSQHDLAFCSGRTEWGFIMCNCRPLRRVSTPVSFGLFSLPLPPPFFLIGIPNVALIWASGFWITLPFTDRDLNFQLFSCALARSTTPHSPSLSLYLFLHQRKCSNAFEPVFGHPLLAASHNTVKQCYAAILKYVWLWWFSVVHPSVIHL